jgi:hypothetical protein
MTDINRIEKLMQPAAKEKAYQAALLFNQQVFSSTRPVDLDSLAGEAVQGKFTDLSEPEIDVLCAFVLFVTLRTTEEDLKGIEGELSGVKRAELELQAGIRATERLVELVFTSESVPVDLPLCDILIPEVQNPDLSDLVREVSMHYDLDPNITIHSLKDLLDDLKGKLDGMNELSEMTSLRLQMTMDRRSKFISTLSQMIKKISTTQDMLVQNLK